MRTKLERGKGAGEKVRGTIKTTSQRHIVLPATVVKTHCSALEPLRRSAGKLFQVQFKATGSMQGHTASG